MASSSKPHKPRKTLAVFIGTRPEAIKLAPVCKQFDRYDVRYTVWHVTQQAMTAQYLRAKGIDNLQTIEIPRTRGDLLEFHAEAFTALQRLPWDDFAGALVHGDTSTAFTAAMAAYLRQVPVAHVEAGLRSPSRFTPYPEEANRRMIAQLATYHFSPTYSATHRLMTEGIHAGVWETGNTGIDALREAFQTPTPPEVFQILEWLADRRLVVLTFHRRESWAYLPQLVEVLKTLPATLGVVWPRHPNPLFETATAPLQAFNHLHPTTVLAHEALAHLLYHAAIVVTDSGGLIEEAADLDRPCIVLRNETERPEAIDEACELLPLDRLDELPQRIAQLIEKKRHARGRFGDGFAAQRIAMIFRALLDKEAFGP